MPSGSCVGIEIDPLSARSAQLLYPDSQIHLAGFETVTLPDRFFDVVVGNVPFGSYPVLDSRYKKHPFLTRSIHDYFLAKSVDLVRPGGLLALITSRHTLDKQNSAVREYVAAKANLLAAVRLPNGTFRGNAGTDVTTDLLFLQRRENAVPERAQPWLHLKTLQTGNGPVEINEYFVNHPERMLGSPALESTQYAAAEFTLKENFCPQRFAAALNAVPAGLYTTSTNPARIAPLAPFSSADWASIKDGAYGLADNALVIRHGDALEPVNLAKSVESRIRLLLIVRDAIREVLRTQLENSSEEQILRARRQLHIEYDRFFYRFGPISSKENFRAFAGDPDHPLLLSLEDYDPDTKHATKTPIFHQRTIEGYQPVAHVETAAEALLVSLNETGQVDWPRMANLTRKSILALQHELTGLVFRNPEGNAWEPADAYLSGNVRRKLETAAAAAAVSPEFTANEHALRTVQPRDLEPGDIDARLGSRGYLYPISSASSVNFCLPKRNTSQSRTPKASPAGPSNSATQRNMRLRIPPPTARPASRPRCWSSTLSTTALPPPTTKSPVPMANRNSSSIRTRPWLPANASRN
jgi:hypothetical protein